MFCPYCGGDVDSGNPEKYLCLSCGKSIYTDRENIRHFIRPGELEGRFNEALDALDDDNTKKAAAIADELISVSDETDFDAFFLRGAVYASLGEEGKAFMDWKKGLELLTVYTNIDAYICLMAKCISDMIYMKEEEYLDFDPVRYADKISDEIRANTDENCKAFLFYNIYKDYRSLVGRKTSEGGESYEDAIPRIFKRVVEYHRNFPCLIRIIDEYLKSMSYNRDTYVEDDMEDLHIYDLLREDLEKYIENLSEDDLRVIRDHWDDESLKFNEEALDNILGVGKDRLLKRLAKRGTADAEPISEPDAVDLYVRRNLMLDEPEPEKETSENPEVLE